MLGSGENFGFGRFCVLHFAFEFPAKNSEFFRFKYLNFPPTFLDSIGGGGGGGGKRKCCEEEEEKKGGSREGGGGGIGRREEGGGRE